MKLQREWHAWVSISPSWSISAPVIREIREIYEFVKTCIWSLQRRLQFWCILVLKSGLLLVHFIMSKTPQNVHLYFPSLSIPAGITPDHPSSDLTLLIDPRVPSVRVIVRKWTCRVGSTLTLVKMRYLSLSSKRICSICICHCSKDFSFVNCSLCFSFCTHFQTICVL